MITKYKLFEKKKKFPNIKTEEFEGFKIKIGKDAESNDYLVRTSDENDLWFHTDEYPSSHVVIKIKDKLPMKSVIRKAAELTKHNSKGKKEDNVKIIYCKIKFVKKLSYMKPGEVDVDEINANFIII